MKSLRRMRRGCSGLVKAGAFTSGAMLLVIGMLGCDDHRISVEEFKQLQATMEETQASETAAIPAPPPTPDAGVYRIGVGDVLGVSLTGDPTVVPEPFQVRVDRQGVITLPMVGQVRVGGMDLIDAEAAVRQAYVPDYLRDAAVHLAVLDESDVFVLVMGAAMTPGLVTLNRTQSNVLHAIVAAGGLAQNSSGKAIIRRVRQPEEPVEVDLYTPGGVRQALAMPPLEQGDVIELAATSPNYVYVQGLVNYARPQEVAPRAKVTVLQVLAAAGGLRTDITPKEGTLIRRLPNGEDVHVKLDLWKIQRGEAENIELAAGDILWVPYTAETRVQDFINRNFFLRAGISVNYNVSGIEFLNRQDQQSGGISGSNLQDRFDPFGFLNRNQSLQSLVDRPVTP